MENQENIKENEEISIIDLLAVLIKYRKLIIIGTVIPTVVAALWLFVAKPILKPVEIPEPETKTETRVVYTLRSNYLSKRINDALWQEFYVSWDFYNRILDDFKNPNIIGKIYYENQFSKIFDDITEEQQYIIECLDDNLFTLTNPIDINYALTILIPIKSFNKLDDFVNAFINYEIDLANEKFIRNYIDICYERYTEKIAEVKNANPKTVNFDEIQRIKDTVADIELYRKENKPFFEIIGDPVIDTKTTTITPPAPPKEPKVKELIIVAVASLFIFIFIAFLLNAIQNIKDDPVSSQKIKDAWKAGK